MTQSKDEKLEDIALMVAAVLEAQSKSEKQQGQVFELFNSVKQIAALVLMVLTGALVLKFLAGGPTQTITVNLEDRSTITETVTNRELCLPFACNSNSREVQN